MRVISIPARRALRGRPAAAVRRSRSQSGHSIMVVVGELGVLTDYSVREADNRRFALNIVRWLARRL